MQIDLNNPKELTYDNVRKLIASKDDSQNRQLRVRDNGIAYISDVWGNIDTHGHQFWYETWLAGNSYLGEKAAADRSWVERVYQDLQRDWYARATGLIDY